MRKYLLLLVSAFALAPTVQASDKLDAAQRLAKLMASTFETVDTKAVDAESSSRIRERRIILDNMPGDEGAWVYYQLNTGKENKLYRQRIIHLVAQDENTVRQILYTPADTAAWEDAWDKPELLSKASLDDLEASLNPGCELVWTRPQPIKAPRSWRGYVDPKACKVFSKRRNKEILIEGETLLSPGYLKQAERGFDIDGKQIWGSKPDEFNVLERQHSSSASVVEFASESDWRTPKPENLMLMQLESGDVWFELAPQFAPKHVKNIRKLISQKYFDGLKVIRSQDNYVAQWGDPETIADKTRSLGKAKSKLAVEFFRKADKVSFTPLEAKDAYADRVGHVDGFPVAGDAQQLWLSHCYGMLGVGRDVASDSGNGSSLYMVTGHAPRHLDRNVTLVGRVLVGAHRLSSLPRGNGPLGFYENESEYVTIKSIRLGSQPDTQFAKQVMRTDTETFKKFVNLRTNRNEDWFLEPTGRIGLCNVAVPLR